MSGFRIDPRRIADKKRKPGVSGMLRVKNDAEFIEQCVESCLPALDELIITYNDCSDNSPDIIHELCKKYPEKIKAFHFTPHIHAWNLSPEEAEQIMNGNIPPENTLAGYYNYTLSKTSHEFVMKIDTDQIYFTKKLKAVCDLYRHESKPIALTDIITVSSVKAYLMAAIRLKRRCGLFSNKTVWKHYLKSLHRLIISKKIDVSLSGINMIAGGNAGMPLVPLGEAVPGGVNIMSPYNGEGDHQIFRVTNHTFFIPAIDKAYNELNNLRTSVIERLTGTGPILPCGIFLCHLNACRKPIYAATLENINSHSQAFATLDEFSGAQFFELSKQHRFDMSSPKKAVLFDFIHNDIGKQITEQARKINNRFIL